MSDTTLWAELLAYGTGQRSGHGGVARRISGRRHAAAARGFALRHS